MASSRSQQILMTWVGSKSACLGREGFAGASVILNADPWSVHRAFSQVPGEVYRLSSTALRSAVEQSESLRDLCLRHVEMLMVQTSQVAACNARHNLPERLARCLLMVRDRTDSDNLPITQEFLSVMLGVRRPGVSVAASTAANRRPHPGVARACSDSRPRSGWQPLPATAIALSSKIEESDLGVLS